MFLCVYHLPKRLSSKGKFWSKVRFNSNTCVCFFSAIKTLARNDANKKLLVQLGAIDLLVELTEGDEDEQTGPDTFLMCAHRLLNVVEIRFGFYIVNFERSC